MAEILFDDYYQYFVYMKLQVHLWGKGSYKTVNDRGGALQ
jgi:hypothetical protein